MTLFKYYVLFFYYRFKYMSQKHFEIPTSPSSPYKYKHKPIRKFKSIPTELYTSDLNSQDYDSSMLNDTKDYYEPKIGSFVNRKSYVDKVKIPDIRKTPVSNDTLYDQLINIILNAKKDIKHHRSCETFAGAERYAKSHDLRVGPPGTDINGDGFEDVVLYNKAGLPVMINGYRITPSEYPYRQQYLNQNPTAAQRCDIGGYAGWKRDLWEVDGDFDDKGERKVGKSNADPPALVNFCDQHGWKKLSAPKAKLSVYQRINRWISDMLQDTLKTHYEGYEKTYNYILPRFKIISFVNSAIFDRLLIDVMRVKNKISGATPNERYNNWKAFKQSNNKSIKSFIEDNYDKLIENAEPECVEKITQIIDMLINQSGYQIPDDKKFKEEIVDNNNDEFRKLKLELKDVLNQRFDILKNQLINWQFSDDQQPSTPTKS